MSTPIKASYDEDSPIDVNKLLNGEDIGEGFLLVKAGKLYLSDIYTEWSHRAKNFYDNTDKDGNPLIENNPWKKMPLNGKPDVILDGNGDSN